MPDALTVIRHAERPTVAFAGGATYQPIIGDDTGGGLPIRTGIQTSPPGYQTALHSHPYAEVLTVLAGRGEAWLADEDGVVALEPGVSITFPANRVHAFRVVGGSRSSPSASTLSASASSTMSRRRLPVAELFFSALCRGTLDRSFIKGDQGWPSAVSI